MATRGSSGNVIAALCSVFVPGLGQLIQARPMRALIQFAVAGIGYALWFLVVPLIIGALVHLWSILDAATFREDAIPAT